MAVKVPFVKPHREGFVILFMIPNFWGTGKNTVEAMFACRRAGGKFPAKAWAIWSVSPNTTVSEIDGTLCWPKDEAGVLLCASQEV